MTYFYDLNEQFASDIDSYFQQAQVINFNIINYECHGTVSQNSEQHYKAIQKKTWTSSERDDVYFEHDLLRRHFKEKTDIEKDLISNGFFLKKKKNNTDFTKLNFQHLKIMKVDKWIQENCIWI